MSSENQEREVKTFLPPRVPGIVALQESMERFNAPKKPSANAFHKPQPVDEQRGMVDHIHNVLGCRDPLTKKFIEAVLVMIQVFDYKQGKYGPGNIAKFGEFGVTVRAHDKIERLINLQKTGQEPADETRDDSWGDLATYSMISLLCRWGWWPGVEASKR